MLKIIDLHKSYGTKEVIKGLNLEVEDGKMSYLKEILNKFSMFNN